MFIWEIVAKALRVLKGKVNHFELPAKDVKRAQSFYKDVFEWQVNEMPQMNYTLLGGATTDKNGRVTEVASINGGMMERKAPFTGPVLTITVEDIDSALKEVEKHGGKSMGPKQEIPTMGWSAYFWDPEGNLMGLFQSTMPAMPM
jgi:predicted enzyme related to lactoylglutathione lyase